MRFDAIPDFHHCELGRVIVGLVERNGYTGIKKNQKLFNLRISWKIWYTWIETQNTNLVIEVVTRLFIFVI